MAVCTGESNLRLGPGSCPRHHSDIGSPARAAALFHQDPPTAGGSVASGRRTRIESRPRSRDARHRRTILANHRSVNVVFIRRGGTPQRSQPVGIGLHGQDPAIELVVGIRSGAPDHSVSPRSSYREVRISLSRLRRSPLEPPAAGSDAAVQVVVLVVRHRHPSWPHSRISTICPAAS